MDKIRFDLKENRIAYLWPAHPLVLAGNQVLDDVICGFDKGQSFDTICQVIVEKYQEKYQDVLEYVSQILNAVDYVTSFTEPTEFEFDGISMATLNLTNQCNLQCKHCYAAKSNTALSSNEMSIENLLNTIRQLDKLVTHPPRLLILSGGEPTIRMDALIPAIKLAHGLGFNVRLNSNGLILTTPLVQTLKECNVLTQISIDGANRESHASLRGSEKSYDQTVDSIKILTNSQCRVRISMTTHLDNYKEIPSVFENAINWGAEQFITSNLVVTGRAKENGLKPVLLSDEFEVLYQFVKDDIDLQRMSKSTLLGETINAMRAGVRFINCGTGICTCCVDANGDVFPCINMVNPDYKITNICETSNLTNSWKRSEVIDKLGKISVNNINEKCAQCAFKFFCGAYCRGETIANGKSLYDPYIRCDEWKQALLKVLTILCEQPMLYYFGRPAEMEVISRE